MKIALRVLTMAHVACLLFVGYPTATLAGDASGVSKITVHQVKESMGLADTVVVDVRTYRNWWRSSKKIPTAVREDPARVGQWVDKYSKDQTLIFYCS